MNQKLKAIYRDGTFIPKAACSLPDNTAVEIAIYRDRSFERDIIDPETRKEVLNALLRRMKQMRES
jgi:hypothetical protein